MNERIKELALQAEGEFYISCGNQVPTWYFQYYTLEKFAELIVRECAAIAKKKSLSVAEKAELYAEDEDEKITARATAWQISLIESEIKEHFGVK